MIQNGNERAKYDFDKGSFVIEVPKLENGEHFQGLDMLTKLLAPIGKAKTRLPLIEVINTENGQESDTNQDTDDDYDWNVEQEIWTESNEESLLGEKYGFANSYSGVIARLAEELDNIIDVKNAEQKTLSMRRKERLEDENTHFSDDHYLSDIYDEKEIINGLIEYKAPWELVDSQQHVSDYDIDEKYRLKNLPNKEYIHDRKTDKRLLLGLLDILFAYAYNVRTTENEDNVESGWTICKLSGTLSWFETYNSMNEVIDCCMRRSLCYPLYRNWQLSLKVINDLKKITLLGRKYVLKCLLHIQQIFNQSGDSRYILNDLYITDYCVWIQQVKQETFESLLHALEKRSISKLEIGFDLDVLEKAGRLALFESQN